VLLTHLPYTTLLKSFSASSLLCPTSVGRGIIKWQAVSVHPFVCRVPRSNSRNKRPRKPKIGRMEGHQTGNLWTYLEVKVIKPINVLTDNAQHRSWKLQFFKVSLFDLNWFVAYRLDNFVVGLADNDPAITSPVYKSSYTVCAQYSGSVAASDNATVFCSPSFQQFRFVIVQGSLTVAESLCLLEVSVYARSKYSIQLDSSSY